MKEKIAKKRAEQEGYNHYEEYPEDSGVKRLCRQQADQILTLITEEIENVENPYIVVEERDNGIEFKQMMGAFEFEQCRKKILALLKE